MVEKPKNEQAKAKAEDEVNPSHLSSVEDWDKAGGDEFGGDSEVLYMNPGDVSKAIKYTGSREANLGLGPTIVHDGVFVDNNEGVRLPVSYMFARVLDQSGISKGDVFMVKRMETDIIPKSGPQKGKAIPNFKIKIVKKSTQPF